MDTAKPERARMRNGGEPKIAERQDLGAVAVILGAGFSAPAGVPLASHLFDRRPAVDRLVRQRLVERVTHEWRVWYARTGGSPEEYLAGLAARGGIMWREAVWFVSVVIATRMGKLRPIRGQHTLTAHYIQKKSPAVLEQFWSTLFRTRTDVSVITTNYDILPERGLRNVPRPRVHRPGFHYGFGSETLLGGGFPNLDGYPSYVAGQVPLLKLHGSVSWSFERGRLVKYHDCRPAMRGDPAIVAPIVGKTVPHLLRPTWRVAGSCLARAPTWVVVGYSLPVYDELVRELFVAAATPATTVHVLDPDPTVCQRFRALLPKARVYLHPGLPEGTAALGSALFSVSRPAD